MDPLEVPNVNRDVNEQNGPQLGAAVAGEGFRRGLLEAHATAAGGLCADDGSGCCGACGVSLDTCPTCQGLGYHRAGCADSEEVQAAAQERRAVRRWQDEHGVDEAAARAAVVGNLDRLERYGYAQGGAL